MTDNKLLSLALAKISKLDFNTRYAVKQSSDFVNEYAWKNNEGIDRMGTTDDPNIWLASFPMLFPYGEGGIEIKHLKKVSLSEHVKWAL